MKKKAAPTMVMTAPATMTVMSTMMPIVRGRTRIRTMMVLATSTRLMTARMTTVITLRCYIFSTDRITQVGPVWCHPSNTWVAPGLRLHSVQTESDPVTPGLRRVLRGQRRGHAKGYTPVARGSHPVCARSHPDHPRVTPGRHPVTPWSLPGRTPVTPNLCSDHARDIACHGQVALGSHLHCNRGRQSYTKVTTKLSQVTPSYTQATPGCTGATPRLRTIYAPVVPR